MTGETQCGIKSIERITKNELLVRLQLNTFQIPYSTKYSSQFLLKLMKVTLFGFHSGACQAAEAITMQHDFWVMYFQKLTSALNIVIG